MMLAAISFGFLVVNASPDAARDESDETHTSTIDGCWMQKSGCPVTDTSCPEPNFDLWCAYGCDYSRSTPTGYLCDQDVGYWSGNGGNNGWGCVFCDNSSTWRRSVEAATTPVWWNSSTWRRSVEGATTPAREITGPDGLKIGERLPVGGLRRSTRPGVDSQMPSGAMLAGAGGAVVLAVVAAAWAVVKRTQRKGFAAEADEQPLVAREI